MKLYITEKLNFKATNHGDIKEISEFLKGFSIINKIEGDFIFIESQKVNLDEIAMNELFDEIFWIFDIEYACIGGAGCEFAINVKLMGE